MERLTKEQLDNLRGLYESRFNFTPLDSAIHNALEELAEYRRLEKGKKLFRLQFKVDDVVWEAEFGRVIGYEITGYSFGRAEDYIDDPVSETEVVYYYTNLSGSITGSFAECEIGKTMFHYKEEAEAALEKMKGEER